MSLQPSQILDFDFRCLETREQLVVILGLLTGIIHLIKGVLGLLSVVNFMQIMLVLNFFGNIILISAMFFVPPLKKYHEYIRWIFITFTASSIFMYFVTYAPSGIRSLLFTSGIFDKLLEVALIVLLLIDRPFEEDLAEHGAEQVTGSPQRSTTK